MRFLPHESLATSSKTAGADRSGVDRKALAVVAPDVLIGRWHVFGLHRYGIPLDCGACLECDNAQENGFGKPSGIFEV